MSKGIPRLFYIFVLTKGLFILSEISSSLVFQVIHFCWYNLVKECVKAGMSMLRGGAQVLASVSEYPYTRKSWRKDGMELLLDPAFFQMDHDSLRYSIRFTL